jgi:dimethylglycine catabolism A
VTQQVVRPATAGELEVVVERYAAAARRCREGGLDGVEISMAHGLLLAAFLSPLMNRRDDEYGGTLDARMRFPLEVLDAVRAACGLEMIVGVRLGVDDLREGGLRPADAAEVARRMQDRVDYLSVIVGNNNWLEPRVQHWPPTPAPHGLFRGVARRANSRHGSDRPSPTRATTWRRRSGADSNGGGQREPVDRGACARRSRSPTRSSRCPGGGGR